MTGICLFTIESCIDAPDLLASAPFELYASLFLPQHGHYVLCRLSDKTFRNPSFAVRSSLLFLLNPASIFFAAPYTEAVYTFFTWAAFVLLYHSSWASTLLLTLSATTRSNGGTCSSTCLCSSSLLGQTVYTGPCFWAR